MAGLGPVWESVMNGSLPRCHDGSLLQPLDVLFLLLSNNGYKANASERFQICYVAKLHRFPSLSNLLPARSVYFTPDDLIDSLIGLFICCIIVAVGLILTKNIWSCVDPQFRSVSPPHKQWYVVANLCKSFFLGCMALSPRYWTYVYNAYILEDMDMIYVKRCAVLYLTTDVVALFMVPKLPRSTIVHHIATAVVILTVTAVDMDIKGYHGLVGVSKMAILYGIFSIVPYLVNAYLALRVVYPKAPWLSVIVKASLWTYIICCICNWSSQLVWIMNLFINVQVSIFNILYLLPIGMMANDDVVLIKWLMKKSSPILEDSS